MNHALLKIEVKYEHDVVLARQRARQIAQLLGFDLQDQARIATAVSELARNIYQYAGTGRVEFSLSHDAPQALIARFSDKGPGIAALNEVLGGSYRSQTGMGLGITGARRLMDRFEIDSAPGSGTTITLGKHLPAKAPPVDAKRLAEISKSLVTLAPDNPFGEIQQQNQELLATLEEMHQQKSEMAQLNRELEETNRGVVALYAELDERADYLRRASEQKTQFLSNMTHEFRTPMNSILSISQMLLDRLDGALTPEQEKQVRFIQSGAKSLTELVNDLLDLAKVEAGKISVRPSRFEVGEMFGTLRGMLKPLIEDKHNVALIFDVADVPPLHTDEGKLSQILRNFISNGLKFTKQGEVHVSAVAEGDQITFSVRDTGIGIASQDHLRIFEEFVQIEGTHQQTKGTGLGLPLSKRLSELLGGYVTLESAPGEGATFRVTIPIRYQGPAVLSFAKSDQDGIPAMPSFAHLRALLIDDEEADRYVLKRLLGEFELEIAEATGGVEGLELAREKRPDIIFLDVTMPDMGGEEVLRRLQEEAATAAIPVIIHTSKSLTKIERDSLGAHAVAILSKNHASRELSLSRIREQLETIDANNQQKGQRHG